MSNSWVIIKMIHLICLACAFGHLLNRSFLFAGYALSEHRPNFVRPGIIERVPAAAYPGIAKFLSVDTDRGKGGHLNFLSLQYYAKF